MLLDYIETQSLIPYARNAKLHSPEQVTKIAGSIREFGFNNPILIDAENGIIAGHGRVLAAQKLCLEKVPCIRIDHLTENQKRAYIIADNRLGEIGGGWDVELLKLDVAEIDWAELNDVQIDDFKFDSIEQEEFAQKLHAKESELPEPPIVPITKTGDIWLLGDHVLICEDYSKVKDFEKNCSTLVFDPPWELKIEMKPLQSTLAFCDGQRMFDTVNQFGSPTWAFAWDCVSSWFTPSRPLKRMKLCLWYGQIDTYNSDGAHYGEPGISREVTNTRGSYEYKSDPRGKHLSDVFSSPITKLHSESNHSHSKPIDWIRMLLGNCTQGNIYDPFLGSGTTLIAAEQLNRKCFGVEINPSYCDLIISRWESFTGNKAIKQ